MKCGLRVGIGIAILSIVPLTVLLLHLSDLSDQYNTFDFVQNSVSTVIYNVHEDLPAVAPHIGDKIIVMARTEEEDTSWVAKELPE